MPLLTNYAQLDGESPLLFIGISEEVVMSATGQSELLEEGKLPKRISDNLANRGIVLVRKDCMPDPEASMIVDPEERSAAVSFHYSLVKIWFLISWLNKIDSSDLSSELEEKARKATNADEVNEAIQKLVNGFPFVGSHLAVITAMRVRALSLNPFQESIGMTPELNQVHVDFKVSTAPASYLYNNLKDNAIKDGTYSKAEGLSLLNCYRKRISSH
jgi:hypothetical protein